MPKKNNTSARTVETLTHEEATRKNIPTAEHQWHTAAQKPPPPSPPCQGAPPFSMVGFLYYMDMTTVGVDSGSGLLPRGSGRETKGYGRRGQRLKYPHNMPNRYEYQWIVALKTEQRWMVN